MEDYPLEAWIPVRKFLLDNGSQPFLHANSNVVQYDMINKAFGLFQEELYPIVLKHLCTVHKDEVDCPADMHRFLRWYMQHVHFFFWSDPNNQQLPLKWILDIITKHDVPFVKLFIVNAVFGENAKHQDDHLADVYFKFILCDRLPFEAFMKIADSNDSKWLFGRDDLREEIRASAEEWLRRDDYEKWWKYWKEIAEK
jgi:hypothetical protein